MTHRTEAAVETSAGKVEIRDYVWPEPLDAIYCDRSPVFGLSLTGVPHASRGRFLQHARAADFRPIGRLVFRPAELPMHCINAGGSQRLLLCELSPCESIGDEGRALIDRFGDLPPNPDLRNGRTAHIMRRIAAEVLNPGFASEVLVGALINSLAVEFLRSNRVFPASAERSRGGLAGWQMRRIQEILRETDGTLPSVAELAKLVGVSTRHLLRAFRQQEGMSVSRYIARARFSKACVLLTGTDVPIKQIAYSCGFSSSGSFITAFRLEGGVTPRVFRLQNRASVLHHALGSA